MVATIRQERRAVLVDDVTQFELRTIILDPDTFPDNGLFLLSIIDESDPRYDVLSRVVAVADFAEFPIERETALESGLLLYRSSEFTRRYTTLDTAVAASQVVRDRLSGLKTTWDSYEEDFETTGEDYTLPLVDLGLLAGLILAYTSASDALVTAQAVKSTADAEVVAARDNVTDTADTRETLAIASSTVEQYADLNTTIGLGATALDNLATALGVSPPSGWGTTDTEGTGFYRTLNNYLFTVIEAVDSVIDSNTDPSVDAALQIILAATTTFNSSADAFVSSSQAYTGSVRTQALSAVNTSVDGVGTVIGAHATALSEAGVAVIELTAAESEALSATLALTSAQKASNEALAAIVEVVPDFDPNDPEASLEV